MEGLGHGNSHSGLVEPPAGPGPQVPLHKMRGLALDEWFSSTFKGKATLQMKCLAELQLSKADREAQQGAAA